MITTGNILKNTFVRREKIFKVEKLNSERERRKEREREEREIGKKEREKKI